MLSLKKRVQVIKSDKVLNSIILIHLLLAVFHFAYSFFSRHPQCYIRCGFCLFIAVCSFFFLRKGFSISIMIYGCVLLYLNRFFNYTGFLFILFAIYCTPAVQIPALVVYGMNVFISFGIKRYEIMTLGIHMMNCFLFYVCAKYLFAAKAPETLFLTDDERDVISELAAGKMQKQIDLFSQNTITKLLKNAMARNLCKTKAELIHKYLKENPAIESQNDCESITD